MLHPGQMVQDLLVEGLVGEGATSYVYRVRMPRTGAAAVLKIAKKASAKVNSRLEHEARVQGQIVHPNVVPVLRNLQIDGCTGIVMGLVEGPSLAMLLQRRTFSLAEALAIGEKLIRAVEGIHAAGVVHRDLKPSNVLVHINGSEMEPYIADFGLSCHLADDDFDSMRSGVLYGTPGYMAPERLIDPLNTDVRCDVFALGTILYHLACGQPAFPSTSDSIFVDIAEGRFVRPGRNVNMPSHVETAVVGCLLPDVTARIPDCSTLLTLWRGEGSTTYKLPPGLLEGLDRNWSPYRSEPTIIPNDDDVISGERIMPVPQFAPQVRHLQLPPALQKPAPASEPPAPPVQAPEPVPPRVAPPQAQTQTPPQAERSRKPLLALLLLLAGVGVWAVWSGGDETPVSSPPVASAPPEPTTALALAPEVASPPPADPALPTATPPWQGHSLILRSNPTGSDVWEGDQRLGSTPMTLAFDGVAHTYTLRRRDYASEDYTVEPSQEDIDRTITLRATRQERPERSAVQERNERDARAARVATVTTPTSTPASTPVPTSTPAPAPAPAPAASAQATAAKVTAPTTAPETSKSAAATATLTDLDVSVKPTSVTLRGKLSGATRPLGMLMEDDDGCEYRIKLASTRSEVGLSRLPVASTLVQQISVSESSGAVTVRARCGSGGFTPNLSSGSDGFVLVLSQKQP